MCCTLGCTLRTYLYCGWSATSGNGVRLNRRVLTTSSDSVWESVRSRVITYRPMTMAAATSKVARRRRDPGGRFILRVSLSCATDTERIGNSIDVVEPGGDQRYLQDSPIVEAGLPQRLVVVPADLGGVLGQLHRKFEHDAIV